MSPIVLKIGGEVLTAKDSLNVFLQTVNQVIQSRPVILVHGGGPQVESYMAATKQETVKVSGLRATPEQQLPFVVGALAGLASQQLLAACKANGMSAIGLSLSDGNLFKVSQIDAKLGYVGQVEANNSELLDTLLTTPKLICFSSIGCDEQGQLLNVNADDAAVAVAKLIDGKLCFLSNVPGVLDENKQLISTLNQESINNLITSGVIADGMAVKVNAALRASHYLRQSVNIGSWQDIQSIKDLSQNEHVALGTTITSN